MAARGNAGCGSSQGVCPRWVAQCWTLRGFRTTRHLAEAEQRVGTQQSLAGGRMLATGLAAGR